VTRHRFVDNAPTVTVCVAPHVKDPERQRTAHVGLLCLGHYRALEQHLAELPALLDETEQALVRSSSAGPKVTGTPTPPLPYSEAAGDALRDVHARMVSWTLWLLEEHPSGLHSPADDTVALSRFLFIHRQWIAEQDLAAEMLRELREDASTLRRAMAPGRLRIVPLGPCTRDLNGGPCAGLLTAVVRDSDDRLPSVISCDTCGDTNGTATWRALGRRLRGGEELSWFTAESLSRMLRVPLKTVQMWALNEQWRFIEGSKPRRYHYDDAQTTFEQYRESA
jgi:hypothetical protein